MLPTQSVCLIVPVIRPQEYDTPWAQRRREEARKFREAPRKDNDAVVEVAKFLENKLFIHSAKKYLS